MDETENADNSRRKTTKQTKRMALTMSPGGPRRAVGDSEVEPSAAVIRLHGPSGNTPGCRSKDARDKLAHCKLIFLGSNPPAAAQHA